MKKANCLDASAEAAVASKCCRDGHVAKHWLSD